LVDRDRELEIEKKWLSYVRKDPQNFLYFYDKYFNKIYLLLYRY